MLSIVYWFDGFAGQYKAANLDRSDPTLGKGNTPAEAIGDLIIEYECQGQVPLVLVEVISKDVTAIGRKPLDKGGSAL